VSDGSERSQISSTDTGGCHRRRTNSSRASWEVVTQAGGHRCARVDSGGHERRDLAGLRRRALISIARHARHRVSRGTSPHRAEVRAPTGQCPSDGGAS